MNTYIHYVDGKRFEIITRGHRILCDQPAANGGTDAGVTPPEMLLASLGACAGSYAVEYLHARSLSAAELHIHVSAEKEMAPARIGFFRIDVIVPGLDRRYLAGLLRAVKSCLIHNTLVKPPAIQVEVASGPEELQTVGDALAPSNGHVI